MHITAMAFMIGNTMTCVEFEAACNKHQQINSKESKESGSSDYSIDQSSSFWVETRSRKENYFADYQ